MGLSPPAPRAPMHRRVISCEGFRRADGLWDIEGRLTDTKAYRVENAWRGRLEPGEPLHDMQIRLTLDEDMLILRAEAATLSSPFALCGDVAPDFAGLAGLRIGRGWMREARQRVGGVAGCTHLVEMLPVLATTAFQTMRAGRNVRARDARTKPALLNSCHAYDERKDNARRVWPGYFEALEAPLLAPLMAPVTSAARMAAQDRLECRIAALRPPEAEPFNRAAVIGLGTMGVGIATALADAGLEVLALEARGDALERGMAAIRGLYESQLRRGKLSSVEVTARLERIHPVSHVTELSGAEIVIEAIPENLPAKQALMVELDRLLPPEVVLASNTSTLDIDALAAATRRPALVVGTHFFVPANVTKLLEVVRGAVTAPDVLARVRALAARLGKLAVVARICDGFIGNRMFDQYLRQAMFLVEEGAWPHEVDEALEGWGMAIGPFRSLDMIGNDIPWGVWRARAASQPGIRQPALWGEMVARGWLGRKTGQGWYLHGPGEGGRTPNPRMQELVGAYWVAQGGRLRAPEQRRPIPPARIVARCVLALANEGARLLEEGIAACAEDADMVMVKGYGFPAVRGGPLYLLGLLGLERVEEIFHQFAEAPGGDKIFWEAAPLIRQRDVRLVHKTQIPVRGGADCS
ncbi:3-hydroxyacyl-CoA dehydrogenase NAD-binding domain-containing protein [Acidocella sp.]|uniref:3-hydroxyacyl-CoA dehydrogenase NAD-binding domain-containing protein n=1 Tax=Acidocella sp. TaxID=50710 RepID=UPI003D041FE9